MAVQLSEDNGGTGLHQVELLQQLVVLQVLLTHHQEHNYWREYPTLCVHPFQHVEQQSFQMKLQLR